MTLFRSRREKVLESRLEQEREGVYNLSQHLDEVLEIRKELRDRVTELSLELQSHQVVQDQLRQDAERYKAALASHQEELTFCRKEARRLSTELVELQETVDWYEAEPYEIATPSGTTRMLASSCIPDPDGALDVWRGSELVAHYAPGQWSSYRREAS